MIDEKWGVGNCVDADAFDTVMVNGRPYDLIQGEHPHSRSHDNIYARSPTGEIDGFNGHRILIDVFIKSSNYMKESELSGDEIRKAVNTTISADGFEVLSFFSRDPQYALLRAHHLIGELSDHSSNVFTQDGRNDLVGRAIYYDRTPAVIERAIFPDGDLWIVPAEGHQFPPPIWADHPDDDEYRDGLKDSILSPHIWWWREAQQ